MPLISIVIPCHNSSTYIEIGLNSLWEQEFKDYEVIAIDDKSSDNTIEVLKKYREKTGMNLKILANENNLGPGGSRNLALEVANGQYYAFMDSDDYVEPTYFGSILTEINNGADLINIGSYMVIGDHKTFTSQSGIKTKADWIAMTSGSLCKLICKKDLWDGISIPCISNAEDIAVIPILFYRANKIVNIDKPLYNYIYSSTSTSSKRNAKVAENFKISFRYTKEHFPIGEYDDSLEFHGIKTMLYGATLNAAKAGCSNSQIKKIIEDFEKDWPNWHCNRYISQYKGRKKFYLKLVRFHNIWGIRLFVKLQEMYLRMQG